jgi:hypothetical protein
MWKAILAALAAGVAAVLVAASTRPDVFRVERSARMQAPPEAIHPLIEDFHRWGPWSPYEKRDPAMKRSYGGSPRGAGATYAWEGNADIGKGRMEIVESQPRNVGVDLLFAAPMKAHNRVDFTLTPVGDDGASTHVEWAMTGPQNFVMRVMSKVWSMEKLVGPDLEKGLAKLKQVAESA